MSRRKLISELVAKYKLTEDDYYYMVEKGMEKAIIRRSGIDKIQVAVGMIWQPVNVWVTPYGSKMAVVILGKGFLAGDGGLPEYTLVSVNPDNCRYPNIAEVAEKRCRHRLLLKVTDLYQHNVFSEEESDDFKMTLNQSQIVDEVVSEINGSLADVKKERADVAAILKDGKGKLKKAIDVDEPKTKRGKRIVPQDMGGA